MKAGEILVIVEVVWLVLQLLLRLGVSLLVVVVVGVESSLVSSTLTLSSSEESIDQDTEGGNVGESRLNDKRGSG